MRLANQALILVSPIILVRLLSIQQFGHYREFLLYVGLLSALFAFGINNSLLYFVPAQPQNAWRFVRQSVLLTLFNSLIGAALLIALDTLLGGAVIGDLLLPVCLYVLLFVNVDFWQFLWLARKRPGVVFAYTTGRVLARMTTVIAVAAFTRDVNAIIAGLIAVEAARLAVSLISWRRMVRGSSEEPVADAWREQIRFCAPVGVSLGIVTLNKSLAGMFVAKTLGPVALAHYAIGTYVEPIISILRNSISDALLPEMAEKNTRNSADPLQLWRRTTVVSAVLLLPTAVLLFRFAEPLIATLFSSSYLPAAVILQIYVFTLVRECFDFGVLLRSINRTGPIVTSNTAALLVNVPLLLILMPLYGLQGAVAAFVISRFVDGGYLAWRSLRLCGLKVRELASWSDLGSVVLATTLAAVPVFAFDWTRALGIAGIIPAVLLFAITFALVLRAVRLPEAMLIFARLRLPLGARS